MFVGIRKSTLDAILEDTVCLVLRQGLSLTQELRLGYAGCLVNWSGPSLPAQLCNFQCQRDQLFLQMTGLNSAPYVPLASALPSKLAL